MSNILHNQKKWFRCRPTAKETQHVLMFPHLFHEFYFIQELPFFLFACTVFNRKQIVDYYYWWVILITSHLRQFISQITQYNVVIWRPAVSDRNVVVDNKASLVRRLINERYNIILCAQEVPSYHAIFWWQQSFRFCLISPNQSTPNRLSI